MYWPCRVRTAFWLPSPDSCQGQRLGAGVGVGETQALLSRHHRSEALLSTGSPLAPVGPRVGVLKGLQCWWHWESAKGSFLPAQVQLRRAPHTVARTCHPGRLPLPGPGQTGKGSRRPSKEWSKPGLPGLKRALTRRAKFGSGEQPRQGWGDTPGVLWPVFGSRLSPWLEAWWSVEEPK